MDINLYQPRSSDSPFHWNDAEALRLAAEIAALNLGDLLAARDFDLEKVIIKASSCLKWATYQPDHVDAVYEQVESALKVARDESNRRRDALPLS